MAVFLELPNGTSRKLSRVDIQARRAAIKKLRDELCLTYTEIGFVLGWSKGTIIKDVEALKRCGEVPRQNRKQLQRAKSAARSKLFPLYCQFLRAPDLNPAEHRLSEVIERRLDIGNIIAGLSAMEFVAAALGSPLMVPGQDWRHFSLLCAIQRTHYCIHDREPTPKESEKAARSVWREFCLAQKFDGPDAPVDLLAAALTYWRRNCVSQVFVWPRAGRALLDQILQDLDHREQQIIKMRFGLDGNPPCTLREAAGLFHITRERVRQIEIRALEKLKKSARAAFAPFFITWG